MIERYTLETIVKLNGEIIPSQIKDNKTGKIYNPQNSDELINFLEQINNKQEDTKINIIQNICKNNPHELDNTDNANSIREKYILNRQLIEIIREITQP